MTTDDAPVPCLDPEPEAKRACTERHLVEVTVPGETLSAIHKQVLRQLVNRNSSCRLVDADPSVEALLEATIRDHEGQSVLLVGPRATGKTATVEQALARLALKYPQRFLTVRLNGLHQTTDNMALREIARQLDQQLRVFGIECADTFERRGLGETLETLLQILDTHKVPGAGAERMRSVAVIFVVDEFDRFTYHAKQTLLYNLFELSQNSATAVAVVGLTTKITAREMLEKRVKSRFSQRLVQIAHSALLETFMDQCKANLLVDTSACAALLFAHRWNAHIHTLFETALPLRKLLFQNFYTVKNLKEFLNCALAAVGSLTASDPLPTAAAFTRYYEALAPTPLQASFDSLLELEVCMLVCAARLVEKLELDIVNFNLAFEEYQTEVGRLNAASSLASTSTSTGTVHAGLMVRGHKVWSREACKFCWERLLAARLLVDPVGSNLRLPDEAKMVSVAITLEELGTVISSGSYIKGMTRL